MAKSLEELLAEIERKAKENMGRSSASSTVGATVYEGDTTVPESDATVYESDENVYEGNATVYEAATVSPASDTSYAKGETLLDTYTVESDPIHGGMGSVWRVHHNGWNVDLAMKRPQARLFQSEAQKENFIEECKAWINLGLHPNIVSCYYVREIDGVPTIFSEWMENGSLENHISKGTLYVGSEQEQQERLLDIAIQFARGLHYAHEQGLIHQDVKPDNLLLSKDWDAKVADFGLARARAQLTILEGANTTLDAGATVMAPSGGYTPAYCSMEQMDGKPLTRRTDIYSWAVSVMEMYIGSRPWMNGVVAGLSCRGYFGETRVPMPEALIVLLAQCMAAEPEERPHDFEEIEAELQSIYKAATGRDYPRPVSTAAADTADSLNNRALSYLDLGKPKESERLWALARKANPTNLHALYNQTLFLLRCGKLDPDDAESLMMDNQMISFIHANDEHIRLAYRIGMEISGEEGVRHSIYVMWERKMEREEKLLRSMLESGQLTPNYVLSQIRDMRAYEEQERVYQENLSSLRKSMEDGDMRLATRTVAEFERLCHFQPQSFGDCLNRPEWLTLREQARRKGYPLDVSRVWTANILDGGQPREKLSFSADSRLLLWGERLYKVETGKLLADNRPKKNVPRLCSLLSPDGSFYLRECAGGFEKVDVRSGRSVRHFDHQGKINDLIISADGHHAVSAGEWEVVLLWDLDSGTARGFKSGLAGGIQHVLLSYDNTKLVMQSDEAACMFDMRTGKLDDFGHFQHCRCTHIAANTQFNIVLFTLADEDDIFAAYDADDLFIGATGVMIVNLETKRMRRIEGKDNDGVSLVFGTSPVKAEFANNDVDLLYAIRKTAWVYSSEMDGPLEAVTIPGKITDSAMSRNGDYMAVSNGEKLYLVRVVRDFGAAQEDRGIYPEAWDDVIEFRALEYKSGKSANADIDQLKQSAGKFVEHFITSNRLHMTDTERLLPYAVVARNANRGKTMEQLVEVLATELEDRSLGFISRAKVRQLLESAEQN